MNFKKLFLLLLVINSISIINAAWKMTQQAEEKILSFLASYIAGENEQTTRLSVSIKDKEKILNALTPAAVCYLGMFCIDCLRFGPPKLHAKAIAYIYKEKPRLISQALDYYSEKMPGQHLK